ncbi:unnamed protein product, partial [Ectocarpus fasciculatus]
PPVLAADDEPEALPPRLADVPPLPPPRVLPLPGEAPPLPARRLSFPLSRTTISLFLPPHPHRDLFLLPLLLDVRHYLSHSLSLRSPGYPLRQEKDAPQNVPRIVPLNIPLVVPRTAPPVPMLRRRSVPRPLPCCASSPHRPFAARFHRRDLKIKK